MGDRRTDRREAQFLRCERHAPHSPPTSFSSPSAAARARKAGVSNTWASTWPAAFVKVNERMQTSMSGRLRHRRSRRRADARTQSGGAGARRRRGHRGPEPPVRSRDHRRRLLHRAGDCLRGRASFTRPRPLGHGPVSAVFPFSANGRALSMEAGDTAAASCAWSRGGPITGSSGCRPWVQARVGAFRRVRPGHRDGRAAGGSGRDHPRPSRLLSETVHEAALRALGHAIHI